ncbi:DUF2292 domain-containing protein [Peribacillus sp. SCS-155]|uniref:DUF2292 domain-containing protein n=1 Tax=Peribacillus sedimenti TaxID=3115297 RepID=UPI00390656C8
MKRIDEQKINQIISSLQNIEYGSVLITVHAGEITQIDTTEKIRYQLVKDPSTDSQVKRR